MKDMKTFTRGDKGVGRRRTGSTASKRKPFSTMKTRRTVAHTNGSDLQGLPDIGVYIGPHKAAVRSGAECPYCRDEMFEAQPTAPPGRIVRILKQRRPDHLGDISFDVLAQEIPDTHRVLVCRECRCVFTSPKRLQSVDAVDPHVGGTTE